MLANLRELGRLKPPGFQQDRLCDRELADVVESPADPQRREPVLVPSEPACKRLG